MATLSVTLLDTVFWFNEARDTYTSVQGASTSISIFHNTITIDVGQRNVTPLWDEFWVFRSGLRFDLSELPGGAYITAATLKLDGDADVSGDDFDITITEGVFDDPPINDDYDNGLDVSFGSINSSAYVGGWNNITVNAAGLTYLNGAIQAGEVRLFLKSGEDIAVSEPATTEYVVYEGFAEANAPQLELTYSITGEGLYPEPISFPVAGKVDLPTYSSINSYMTALDADISLMTDGSGNIDLAIANWITWDGTSEKIAYDDGNSHVTITTLASTSIVALVGDLATVDLTIDTTGSAVNATVGNNVTMSDAVYAGIQSVTVDNEITFSAQALAAAENGQGRLDMDSTEGDLVWAVRDDGQAGAKSDILADFSAM